MKLKMKISKIFLFKMALLLCCLNLFACDGDTLTGSSTDVTPDVGDPEPAESENCEGDYLDGDGVTDEDDNCVATANDDQTDTDADSSGDACDDDDGDLVADDGDNCQTTANADQLDSDDDSSDAIIFSLDFNNHEVGPYTATHLATDWNNPTWNDGVDQGRAEIMYEDEERGNVLRIFYPSGKYGTNDTGAQWQLALGKVYEELAVSFYVKFADGFDFVKGGKIPGFAGGDANTGGNKPDGTDGWSARIMWWEAGNVEQYVYHPDQETSFGEDFYWDLEGLRQFVPGEWHHVETRIVMNTPGENDGVIRSWLDGALSLEVTDMRFRDVADLGIDIFYFSTFFGGSDSTWASHNDESVFFDEFMITE